MSRNRSAAFLLLVLTTGAVSAPAREDLGLKDISGRPQSLRDYRGKIAILNFWATWCVPCREEMPMLARLSHDYTAQGVVVIGASTDDESARDKVLSFVRRHKLQFPVWLGATTADMQQFGLGTALPATAIVDREGRIAGRILGPLEEADLRHRIEWLLGNSSGPPPEPVVNNSDRAIRKHEEETGHRHDAVSIEGASSVPS